MDEHIASGLAGTALLGGFRLYFGHPPQRRRACLLLRRRNYMWQQNKQVTGGSENIARALARLPPTPPHPSWKAHFQYGHV